MDGGRCVEGEVSPSAALAMVTAGLDLLLVADFSSATPAELVDLARIWEVEQRRSVAITHAVVAAVGSSGAPGEFGYRDSAALLADVLRLTPGEARARTRVATELGPRLSFTGEPLPPQFEVVAAAQRDGTISAGHAKVVITAVDALSPKADVEHGARVQAELVAHAHTLNPKQLATVAARTLAHLDPDGHRPTEAEQQRHRSVTLASNPDGSGHLTGRLTPEMLAVLRTVLDSLSAPLPAQDGTPDPRSTGQRRHDGLLDLCERALRWGDLPPTGGVPTTLILTMTEEQFRKQQGFAATPHGDLIGAGTVERLADQADILSVVLNASGGVLSYGRTRRLATPAQRLALYARDGGCTFPACTVPTVWTQAHHVQEWLNDNGPTDIDNLALVCGHHHRTFQGSGWTVTMHSGVPWWTPPEHLDPQQKPRQNHYWRRPTQC